MWNLTVFFFPSVLCVSRTQLQNLLLFQEELQTVYPHLSPRTSGEPAPRFCFVFKKNNRFSGSGGPKPSSLFKTMHYYIKEMFWCDRKQPWTHRKYCFFVMQCILVYVGTARISVRAGQLRKLSFLCQHSTKWGIYCSPTTITISIDWISTWKVVDFFL